MSWSNVIVVDQGTHSTRAIIYDLLGNAIFKSQQEVDLYYRDSFQVEQDGTQILNSCISVLDEAQKFIRKSNLTNISVALTTQRSTVIAWDKLTGEAITPALSWLDTRTQNKLENFEFQEDIIKQKTGLPLSPHYGASKLQWLLENDVAVKNKQQNDQLRFGPLATYLIFNLLEHQPNFIDFSNAHRTLLWNLKTKTWDEDLLTAFCIDTRYLPKPVPNSFKYGEVKKLEYPLVLVNGDQNSAVYGYGKLENDTAFVNIGTGAFILARSKRGPILSSKLLSSITYSSESEEEYVLEGTVNGAGAAMTWAEEEWGINEIESIEWKNVEDVPIFLNTIGGLGSPFWRSDIQAGFLQSEKNYQDYSIHQCMAALMESIAFLITINIKKMRMHDVEVNQLLIAGGMSKDEHLCQCLADLCEADVVVSNFKEATSRGAAWLAMQKPVWDILESKHFYPNENNSLLSRYKLFRNAFTGMLH